MSHKISVVIPARNAESTIRIAIQSALTAGCEDVIVVNDASEDATYDKALAVAQDNPGKVRIFWTGQIRAGVCHARNLGISHARHALILPLDADDSLLPEALEAFASYYQPKSLVYSGWLEDAKEFVPSPPGMLKRKNVAYATWLFEKDAWKEAGGYDPAYNLGAEDYHFMVKLVNQGVTPIRIEAALYRRAVNIGTRTDVAKHRKACWCNMMAEEFPDFIIRGTHYSNPDDF